MAETKRNKPAPKKTEPSANKKHREALLDEALDETFPASDPVAMIEPAPEAPEGDGKD
jgi:hypothetical protein